MQKKKINSLDLEELSGTLRQNDKKSVPDQQLEKTEITQAEFQPEKKPRKTARKSVSMENTEPAMRSMPRKDEETDKGEGKEFELASTENSHESNTTLHNRWVPILGAVIVGGLVGFLLSFFFLILPLQNQLVNTTESPSNGNSSSNQIKSDLSTTKLKQQEMETRYQAVSDQLESANQYIFLLRMKEQIAIARLLVEQKEGLKARQSLSEIQTRFDHLKPFAMRKDGGAVNKLEALIKLSIQHLISDPESVKSDLTAISDQLNTIETTLFQPE